MCFCGIAGSHSAECQRGKCSYGLLVCLNSETKEFSYKEMFLHVFAAIDASLFFLFAYVIIPSQ